MQPRILLEVNVAGEGSKFGFKPEKLRAEMESLLSLDRLSILGLMCIPPLAEEAEASRKYFVDLRELRDQLTKIDKIFSGSFRFFGERRNAHQPQDGQSIQ